MTNEEKLVKVCADGFAALARCEEIAYTAINYIPLPRGRVYAKQPPMFMGGSDDAKKNTSPSKRGPSPLTVNKPVPLPKLPSGGMRIA